MSIYYCSDHHWGHNNIIKYSNRPFADVDEMNEAMIARWNSRVEPNDTVYHLGDVAFMPAKRFESIANRLNGIIHLCPGNHDSDDLLAMNRWASVHPYREIRDLNKKVVLSHYSHRVWNGSHKGSLMLYGHSHGSLPGSNQSLDVGVDCWDYYPVTMREIMARMATLPPFHSGDHHDRD
jgi:calcineurin-like phosphoesterase family protein